ncbi:unnamed protein product, partial [Brachionus calyciflorus]
MVESFIGTWKLISSENFDDLMKELGVGYVKRKLGNQMKPNIVFAKNSDEITFTTISSIRTIEIKFKLNEEFDEETPDGRNVKTIFTIDGNKLIQTQKDKNGKIVCTMAREIMT